MITITTQNSYVTMCDQCKCPTMHTKIDMKTTYAAVYQVSCTVCQASTYTSYKYEPPVYPEEIDYEDILTKIVNIVSPEETNPLDPKVLKALPELIKNINYWSEY